ncbi:hypothetical protein ACWEGQ_12245 [Streptomyces seoulensis]
MTMRGRHTVDVEALLLRTDWWAVEHCCPQAAPDTPVILRELLDDDPHVQGAALRDLRHAVTHQNTFYSATAPAVTFVAAVLAHPRTLAPVTDQLRRHESPTNDADFSPLRARLLDWLGDTAWDAGQERPDGEDVDIEAFRALRPALYQAIRPFCADPDPAVRDAALAAVLPLVALPELAHHADSLREGVRALATGDGPYRGRAMDALASWGEDISPFRRATDTVTDPYVGGCAEAPPF